MYFRICLPLVYYFWVDFVVLMGCIYHFVQIVEKMLKLLKTFDVCELRKNTVSKYQHNTSIIALVSSFTFCQMIYLYCITCNSTLNIYLFFYYKMQVIFKGFRQRSDFCRGGIFTLKMLINWRAMPIVVLLYS